jgi:hypothetical protein
MRGQLYVRIAIFMLLTIYGLVVHFRFAP